MKFDQPGDCEQLKAADPNQSVLKFMSQRRSALVRSMAEPGPNTDQLELILRIAARTPDHRKLFPWRFIVFEGEARVEFGEHLAKYFKEDCPNMPADRIEHERTRFLRAPLVVGVISSPKECSRGTPKWEQELSAGAVCMNMLLAARAAGFAAQWLTEWYAFDARVDKVLALDKTEEKTTEKIAGFIYMGTATENPTERTRPIASNVTQYWRN